MNYHFVEDPFLPLFEAVGGHPHSRGKDCVHGVEGHQLLGVHVGTAGGQTLGVVDKVIADLKIQFVEHIPEVACVAIFRINVSLHSKSPVPRFFNR